MSGSTGVRIVSSTKDSIYVQWQQTVPSSSSPRGYKIIYQAIGSSFIQQTKLLNRDVDRYDITFLHENTYYNICVRSFLNSTHFVDDPGCVRGSTHTDSLGVAIGSTFGAFLALSFIVLLVFLAKRQHNIQTKKHLGDSGADGGPEMALDDALIHMSDSIYIQLCRQKPGLHDRLREMNAEAAQQQPEMEEEEEEEPNGHHLGTVYANTSGCDAPPLRDVDAAGTRFVEDSELKSESGLSPFEELYEDGLLKPPAIPGVVMQPRTGSKTNPTIQPRPQKIVHEHGLSSEMGLPVGRASEPDLTHATCFESVRT